MALWIEMNDNGTTFVGDDRVKNGGVIRRHNHQTQGIDQVQKTGAVSCLEKTETTASAEILLQRHWK
jgi:hypothetical protein